MYKKIHKRNRLPRYLAILKTRIQNSSVRPIISSFTSYRGVLNPLNTPSNAINRNSCQLKTSSMSVSDPTTLHSAGLERTNSFISNNISFEYLKNLRHWFPSNFPPCCTARSILLFLNTLSTNARTGCTN